MTVENEVANLTTSVDSLTEAVNVKKQTLDASVADSEAARDQSQTARDTAENHKLAAESAATDATNTASSLAGFDLEAIAASKADTAVDVFVYDTSKDSDGGAWRHRTQHTSWYNETLNTATRGSRREFPAVAVIVAEANQVTIYDGDDPALPMWMVFNAAISYAIGTGTSITSVSCLNSILFVASSSGGVFEISFIKDSSYRRFDSTSTATGPWLGSLVNRNSAIGYSYTGTDLIVNDNVNDVAMTVLPDAPIDPATGLPVPTIAVATNGGVSVIKDDGTVVDITSGGGLAAIGFDTDNYIYVSDSNVIRHGQIPSSDTSLPGWSASPFSSSSVPAIKVSTDKISGSLFGSTSGLALVMHDKTSMANSSVAYTTSTYNTGWMNGDIKGAFLSDTDDTDLVGSAKLVTDVDFSTYGSQAAAEADGWEFANISYDVASGSVHFINSSSGHLYKKSYSSDKQYYVEFTITDYVSGDIGGYDGGFAVNTPDANGTYTVSMSPVVLRLGVRGQNGPNDFKVTSIKVYEADEDRSVNNNGLIVNGTVTRTPVATGADLVAYSGFSTSNFLEQPYNPDLDFGTGDFCVMGWVNGSGQQALIHRAQPDSSGGFLVEVESNNALFVYLNASTSWGLRLSTGNVPANIWSFITVIRKSGVLSSYINGSLAATDGGSFSAVSFPNNGDEVTRLGLRNTDAWPADNMALWRISATAPTAEQIAKIYEDEKFLFQENAQATLYGSSDAVTALAHDPVTDLLHVGTSAGRSVFSGLRRVDNTTTAVGTAISASNGLVVEE